MSPYSQAPRRGGLKLVAVFEGMKGLLVILVGFELLKFFHTNIHEAARQVVIEFHLNPASRYPRIFLDLIDHVDDTKTWALAIVALSYAGMRIIEAVGLWFAKSWAEWFAVLSSATYLPFELYELSIGISRVKILLFLVNLGIFLYLARVLFKNQRQLV